MFGLGKRRSKLGRFLDKRGISQQWLSQTAKVNRTTLGKLCNEDGVEVTTRTIKKIITALKKVDPNVKANDFFDM